MGMSANADYSFVIDRDHGIFNFSFQYQIDGYLDPESSEYFGDTEWVTTYAMDGGFFWNLDGAAQESWSSTWELGLLGNDGVTKFTLTFSAINEFTAETVASSWRVFSMAYNTVGRKVAGTDGQDIFIGGFGNDRLNGVAGNDMFDGGDGNDVLRGGDGEDRIDGGVGKDRLIGGAGDDTYWVNAANDRVVENAEEGIDRVLSWTSYKLSAEVEELFLKGSEAINGKGNAGANSIHGNDAVNALKGFDGDDDLHGEGGDDNLRGGAGNDTLDGGQGMDRLAGGVGDDVYVVDILSDTVIERFNEGIDKILAGPGISTYTLGENVEILETWGNTEFHGIGNDDSNAVYGGTANDLLEGKGGSDALYGGLGDDTLIGGAGADELRGGYGIDAASYADATSRVEASLAAGEGTVGDAEDDWLLGIDNLIGSAYDDVFTGTFLDNQLDGRDGADTLWGGGGNDAIIGGAGADLLDGGEEDSDTLSYAGSTAVIVNLATETASGGDAEGDVFSNFENIAGSDGDDILTGSSVANSLWGGAGDDSIHGGGGDDEIEGGAGADWLNGEGGMDTVSYARSTGGVTVDLYTVTVSGGDAEGDQIFDFDNAIGGSGADTLSGHDGTNRFFGGDGADTINAKGGDDYVNGGKGADTLSGGDGIDTISYAGSTTLNVIVYLDTQTATSGDAQGDKISGFENAEGGELNDYLVGSSGANWLSGRAGTDTLDGGAGDDELAGGTGNDTFLYGVGYGHDTVTDFAAGVKYGDRILLSYGSLYDSFDEVMDIAETSGDNVLFDFGNGDKLQLNDISILSLTTGDFAFA
jgi:Ca2+-binding RTX toxin-like protein